MKSRALRSRARGFTLVELVTVMGILVILVTLIVGAAQGIQEKVARDGTRQILCALNNALQNYYEDWGRFPWYEHPAPHDTLGAVAGFDNPKAVPNYCPAPMSRAYENKVEAMLYAALNMRERNGPYMKAGAGNVKQISIGGLLTYRVYSDGWGRPIHYLEPAGGSSVPLLMSEGPRKDFPDDNWPGESKADNLTSYEPDVGSLPDY